METILANYTASITELKKSPTKLLKEVCNEPIAIMNHNSPTAYLLSSTYFKKMMDIVDDYYLSKEVEKRLNYKVDELIEVDINELI